ncbi:MAG: carboxypeptidase regulatory-like domain-containing protein, partial [Proteobacteria bacterium]|nr:carboxypeptidase regulatory-like domain-containing protein [Pseudomonadota bacterium]
MGNILTLLLDSDNLLREGLKRLMDGSDFNVFAEVSSLDEARLSLAQEPGARLVLVDPCSGPDEDFSGISKLREGNDDIKIVVHAATRCEIWRGAMDTGQLRNLGSLTAEFSGSARIQLVEVDWPDGDDDLGSVTVNESASAAVDYEGRFTQDDASYTVWYRVSTADTTTEPEEGGVCTCDPPEDNPDAEGPQCREDAGSDDGATECPMGNLAAHVTDSQGQPVEGATVRLVQLGLTGTTDATGNHAFGSVHEGDYTVEARKEGYSPDPASTSVHVSPSTSVSAELTLSTVLVSITPNQDQKWYVNQPANQTGHHGREITITAETTPATAGIRIYFSAQSDA